MIRNIGKRQRRLLVLGVCGFNIKFSSFMGLHLLWSRNGALLAFECWHVLAFNSWRGSGVCYQLPSAKFMSKFNNKYILGVVEAEDGMGEEELWRLKRQLFIARIINWKHLWYMFRKERLYVSVEIAFACRLDSISIESNIGYAKRREPMHARWNLSLQYTVQMTRHARGRHQGIMTSSARSHEYQKSQYCQPPWAHDINSTLPRGLIGEIFKNQYLISRVIRVIELI